MLQFENQADLPDQSASSIEAPKQPDFQFERTDWSLFGSVNTLAQKAGVPVTRLRRLTLKELTDNALDSGAKKVSVGALGDHRFFVQDDGPGISDDPEVIARLFSINRPLVSSKLWRLPLRGAMGNGLRVVTGAIVASDGALEVYTRNRRFILTPQPDGTTAVHVAEIDFPVGTRIEVTFGSPLPEDETTLLWAKSAIRMAGGEFYTGKPSPHWYDGDHFFAMLQAAGRRPVRDLVANLDGCTGLKAGRITAAVKGMFCADLTREQAIAVLVAARAEARPVPCQRLGKVGKLDTLPAYYAAEEGVFITGGREPKATIPFVVEAWVYAENDGENDANINLFINRTPSTDQPRAWKDKGEVRLYGCGLNRRFDLPKADYSIFLNIHTPYCPITTDSKEPDLRHFAAEIEAVVKKAGKKARTACPTTKAISIRDAAWKVMAAAYLKASAGGKLPANARQVMYAARTPILAMTGKSSFDDAYFTQKLLPDFITENPELTADWDVVFDARGNLVEPHTGTRVPLGTLAVREYLNRRASEQVSLQMGGALYPTSGPRNRYGGVLFVEKEGFDALLDAARIAERFDLAIASTKGMSVTAIRMLLDRIQAAGPIPVYVLHDMDIAGRTIFGTLASDGRRYTYANEIKVYDLGLRYQDVVEMGLESEPFNLGETNVSKVRATLERHGACEGEIAMLLRQRRRVELNAMTSDQFIAFLERRLIECGAKKVIPDTTTLENAWRRALIRRRLADEIELLRTEVERSAAGADVPADLGEQVRKLLNDNPHMAWDEAVSRVLR